jgi:hypothetical protein
MVVLQRLCTGLYNLQRRLCENVDIFPSQIERAPL